MIGKYNAPLSDRSDYAITSNIVIIPDASVAEFPYIFPPEREAEVRRVLAGAEDGVSYEEWLSAYKDPPRTNVPLLNTIIIPNGENVKFAASVNAVLPEYSAFFKIYDQGYSIAESAIDNLLRSGFFIFIL